MSRIVKYKDTPEDIKRAIQRAGFSVSVLDPECPVALDAWEEMLNVRLDESIHFHPESILSEYRFDNRLSDTGINAVWNNEPGRFGEWNSGMMFGGGRVSLSIPLPSKITIATLEHSSASPFSEMISVSESERPFDLNNVLSKWNTLRKPGTFGISNMINPKIYPRVGYGIFSFIYRWETTVGASVNELIKGTIIALEKNKANIKVPKPHKVNGLVGSFKK